MAAEYLENAQQFERMADATEDPELKRQFLDQAAAYRKLAQKRAEQLGLPTPPPVPRQSK